MSHVKKSSLFLVLLVLASWTASFAQSGKPAQDTVKCYGITELRLIAASMIELEACDTLLATSKLMLANRDSMIVEKDIEIFGLSNQLILKEKIISSKDSDIKDLNLKLDNATNANKWLKIGWISTGAVLALSIILGR